MLEALVNRFKLRRRWFLWPALKLVWKASPTWSWLRVLLTTIQGVLPLITLYLSKLIIDTVASGTESAYSASAMQSALFLVAGIAGVTLINHLCSAASEWVNNAHALQVTDYMQAIIQEKSIEADLEYYENARYYDSLQRAQQEAGYRPPQILARFEQVGQSSVSLITMIGLLLTLHWGVIGVLLVVALPAVLVRVKFAGVLYRWQRQRTSLERRSIYLSWMLSNDQFAKEIRLFGLGDYFSQWYRRIRNLILEERLEIIRKRAIANFLAQSLASVSVFLILGFVVQQTISGSLKLGDLVLYYQALQRGQGDLKTLLAGLSGLYEDNLFLANLFEFLDLKPQIINPPHPEAFPRPFQHEIRFQDVGFQYGTTERQALKGINLTLKPGEVIALVGENGSGKTTLVKLLSRLYDPTEGMVLVDGIPLTQFAIADLRRNISVIFQDFVKFHFSAFDNIWLGNVELPQDSPEIAIAAQKSGADAVIKRLPQGYDTLLGKLFEQGEELSLGQWQKIALGRAFLRDASVIVLDEPTSALDAQAEAEIFAHFRELIQGKTAILISHRLSSVKMADRIYVMDQGRIVEQGTHDQLVSLQGTYAHLYEIQAKNYQ